MFLNDTSAPEIYTLSLHAALPISSAFVPIRRAVVGPLGRPQRMLAWPGVGGSSVNTGLPIAASRTSGRPSRRGGPYRLELDTAVTASRLYLVLRLLLVEKTPINASECSVYVFE